MEATCTPLYLVYDIELYKLSNGVLTQLDPNTKCMVEQITDRDTIDYIVDESSEYTDVDSAIEELIERLDQERTLLDLESEYRAQASMEASTQEAWSRGFMGDYEQMI